MIAEEDANSIAAPADRYQPAMPWAWVSIFTRAYVCSMMESAAIRHQVALHKAHPPPTVVDQLCHQDANGDSQLEQHVEAAPAAVQ